MSCTSVLISPCTFPQSGRALLGLNSIGYYEKSPQNLYLYLSLTWHSPQHAIAVEIVQVSLVYVQETSAIGADW